MLKKFLFLVAFMLLVGQSPLAQADYTQRFSLGAGVAVLSAPSGTYFMLGGEYEYRVDPFVGLGAGYDYIFSSPGINELAAPELFLHPFASDLLVSAGPLFVFGSGITTEIGARLGARVPIPFGGSFALIPSFGVDVFSGGPIYDIGMGLEF